jgi:hypothetical protein
MNTQVPDTGTIPGRAPRPRRHKVTFGLIAGGAMILIIAVVFGTTRHAAAAPVTVHGSMTVTESCLSANSDYPDVSTGAQVIITDASGKVLAQGALGGEKTVSQPLGDECDYPFTVQVPSGQARYGITIGHNRGTVWFTPAEMRRGPGLSLDAAPAF